MVLGVKAPIVVLALFVLLLSTFSVVVPVGAQEIQWIKQYGTIDSDFPCGVSADQSGVYVAGTVEDQPLPGQTSAGKTDIFVRKYDFDGNEKWTRQFGSSEDDECGGISAFSSDVSADASGVYVTGATSGTLPAQRMSGIQDAFVRKYDFDGNVVWTKQFGVSNARTRSNGISVHLSGVYIAGDTTGNLGGQNPSPGSLNPFVRKHDFQGNHVWTQQFGDGSAFGVSAHDSGIYVRGLSSHGVGFLRKYNLLGTLEFEIGLYLFGLSVQDKGVYVTGRANDGDFVGQYDFTGGLVWRIISPAPAPQLAQVSVSTDGVYIEGIGTGPQDIIVRQYDLDGNQLWTQSFGTSGSDVGFRISARALDAYVVGTTTGAFAGYEHL